MGGRVRAMNCWLPLLLFVVVGFGLIVVYITLVGAVTKSEIYWFVKKVEVVLAVVGYFAVKFVENVYILSL